MTATLPMSEATVVVGRRLRDCEDGGIYLIVGVDEDGNYLIGVWYEGYQGMVEPKDVHDVGESHLPCRCEENEITICDACEQGTTCLDCYTWVDELRT